MSPLVITFTIGTTFMMFITFATTVSSDLNWDSNNDISIITDETPANFPNVNTSEPDFSLIERNSDGNDAAGDEVEESEDESSLGKNAAEPEASGDVKPSGPYYGSCFLELNTTGDLANNCLKKTNADGSIKNVFLPPDQVKPADIGMYCSIWIQAKICEINTTCEKCPNEGALAEHFLKDSARQRYGKYCHDTEVTFHPLEKTLCDVTPSSKTGLIITVVVLVFIIIGLCTFICFYAPFGGKEKKLGTTGDDKTTSKKAKPTANGASGTAGTKPKQSKVKLESA